MLSCGIFLDKIRECQTQQIHPQTPLSWTRQVEWHINKTGKGETVAFIGRVNHPPGFEIGTDIIRSLVL